jgi:hypothetical protein
LRKFQDLNFWDATTIDSIPNHFVPHFEFQTPYGTIHRSNVVLVLFDPCFSKSLSFCVLTLSVYIFTHISYAYDYVTNMWSPLLSFQ